MKVILKPKNTIPLSSKLLTVVAFLIACISFFYALKYSGENKKEVPELITDKALLPPKCPSKGGFYGTTFSIILNAPIHSTKIYYTLDGSEPSLKSTEYIQPIFINTAENKRGNLSDIPTSPRWKPALNTVFKGTVLRAIAVTDDNKKSEELIRTFFINKKATKKYSLPIIALTVNADDLFGYKNGIYVLGKNYEDKSDYLRKSIPLDLAWWDYPANYLKRGSNSERRGHIEFYENDGRLAFEANAGLRINGNATRGFAQKSLRVCFDKDYGMEQLNYKLFPDNEVETFNSFILRNGGNDWNKTMFRDAFMQSLMRDAKLDVQADRAVIVFINGEYWGIHNIRERFDENYIANKYKIKVDNIAILELGGNLFYGKKSDAKEFGELLAFIKNNDLSQSTNYEYVKQRIDIESFMDFIIANVYFCNSDWPNNNVKFWHYKTFTPSTDSSTIKDGRWRWMLYDTDWGFGYTGKEDYQLNLLEKARETGSVGLIFDGLLKNDIFFDTFINRFKWHLGHTFDKDRVLKKIDDYQSILNPEMNEHINRWRIIGSYTNWNNYVEELRVFATKRPAVQIQQLETFIENNRK
jgi:hypothetical protein